jgi:hypothetical protein
VPQPAANVVSVQAPVVVLQHAIGHAFGVQVVPF